VIEADLRDPAAILSHPRTLELIDFHQPMAVLLVAVLHFIGADDDPYGIVGFICEAMAPGSYLVVSHGLEGMLRGDSAEKVEQQYRKTVASGATLRDHDEILRFFTGFELVEPGLVRVPHWRPNDPEPPAAGEVWVLGGIGRKPGFR
jgi:hypothetical protein